MQSVRTTLFRLLASSVSPVVGRCSRYDRSYVVLLIAIGKTSIVLIWPCQNTIDATTAAVIGVFLTNSMLSYPRVKMNFIYLIFKQYLTISLVSRQRRALTVVYV